MRLFVAFTAAVVLATGTAGAQTASSDKFPALAGVWTCTSGSGNVSTHTFTQNPDGSIDMKNELKIEGSVPNTEHYVFDKKHNTWNMQASYAGYQGSAPAWSGDEMPIVGKMTAIPDQPQLRITYDAVDATHFKRSTAYYRDNAWAPGASETCAKS